MFASPSFARGSSACVLLLFLFALSMSPCQAQFGSNLGGGDDDKACPVGEAKKAFDVNKVGIEMACLLI